MSILDNESILSDRSDSAAIAWAAGYANEFISKIRFIGAVDSLPKLAQDMIGEVYLLKCGDNLETYVVVEDNLGRIKWMQLGSTVCVC